jgi:MEMO1 family protein
MTSTDIRPTSIAGRWYPADPEHLENKIDGYLRDAHIPHLEGEVVAIIVPHAGLAYSGPVAAFSFMTLINLKFDLVAVVSPMHHPYTQALLTSGHSAYGTPFGQVQIDHEVVSELRANLTRRLGFGLSPVRKDPEHSLEIELPFLQRVLPEFKLLPVMIRDQSLPVSYALGQALAETLKKRKALLVASSDLSHFYRQDQAKMLDTAILKEIEALNPEGVLAVQEQGKGYACGKGAVAAVLWAAIELGAKYTKILHYATSGDVTGDYDQVVGYASAVCLR